jgi:hypothetical protein
VLGAGPIGLVVLMCAQAYGADQVVVSGEPKQLYCSWIACSRLLSGQTCSRLLCRPLAQTMWWYQVRAKTYVVLLVTGPFCDVVGAHLQQPVVLGPLTQTKWSYQVSQSKCVVAGLRAADYCLARHAAGCCTGLWRRPSGRIR